VVIFSYASEQQIKPTFEMEGISDEQSQKLGTWLENNSATNQGKTT